MEPLAADCTVNQPVGRSDPVLQGAVLGYFLLKSRANACGSNSQRGPFGARQKGYLMENCSRERWGFSEDRLV